MNTLWRADFRDRAVQRVVELDRSLWPPFPQKRDLIVRFRADDDMAARDHAFREAKRAGLRDPFLGELINLEPKPGTSRDYKQPPWVHVIPAIDKARCEWYSGCRHRGGYHIKLLDPEVGCRRFCLIHVKWAIFDLAEEEERYRVWRADH